MSSGRVAPFRKNTPFVFPHRMGERNLSHVMMMVHSKSLLSAISGAIFVFLLLSCSHIDDPGSPCGGLLEYDADTVAVCFSDSAVAFVGSREEPARFNLDAYLLREYNVARDPETSQGNSIYPAPMFIGGRNRGRHAFLIYPIPTRTTLPAQASRNSCI